MKIRIVFLLIILWPIICISQPSFTATNYADANDEFLLSVSTPLFVNFAQTGANHVWDYSNININTQENRLILDPGATGYFFPFFTNCLFQGNGPFTCTNLWNSLTDLAEQDLDEIQIGNTTFSNLVRLQRKTAGTLEETILGITVGTGALGIPLTISYDNIDTVYRFPLNYQDTDVSSSSWGFDLTGLGFDFVLNTSQVRTNTVEGWGQLTTPYTTFPSVLKMKTVIQNNDVLISNGTTVPLPSTEVEYKWFDPAFGIPVLKASGNIVFGTELITRVEFLDTLRCLNPTAFFLANPAVSTLDALSMSSAVSFLNFSSNADTYSWNFDDGMSSNDAAPTHDYSSSGTFNVELSACNTSCLPAVCDTFSFPILINEPMPPVSVENIFSSPDLNLFPNPTSSELNIEISSEDFLFENAEIEIRDLTGKLLFHENHILHQNFSIRLGNWPEGIYIFSIRTSDRFLTGKFIKI